ncbi:MAG: hypothetical protein GXY84_00315 [Clostridiales bacterium]|nr:hypothetical protein [Clostridiales bacterium]
MKRFAALLLALLCLLAAWPGFMEAPRALSVGSSGPAVVDLQIRLSETGFLTGPADGKFGEGTRQAVLALQRALREAGHQLAADGIAGQATLSLLNDEEAMAPFLTFTTGATGPRVIRLQTRLIDLKFLQGPADGVFGSQTLEALTAFQRQLAAHQAEGVEVNGQADAATRAFLDEQADLSGFDIAAPEFFDESQPLSLTGDYLNAAACVLVDMRSGRVLFASDMEKRLFPASTTKMMTLLLAVERGRLDEEVILPEVTGKVPRDSSLVPVYPGEKMRMRDLLYGLMIRSGNDAANAVAQICAGSVERFVAQMNQRARQLGMENTHFQNPHGYHHQEHYSTAKDLAILALHGMANPDFAQIASALTYDLPATQKRGILQINNTNELLIPGSPHYYEGAVGIKSGYTSLAGFCYAGGVQREGQQLLAVIMGSRTRNRGWDDLARLFNYGFALIKGQAALPAVAHTR